MLDAVNQLVSNLSFVFQRLNWVNLIDLVLVAMFFFAILMLLRDTQAMALLRGILIFFVLIALLTTLDVLPAFSWLISAIMPALLFSIPVIFAPEIRRTLERLGRAGSLTQIGGTTAAGGSDSINAVISAVARLSNRHHGALIIIQRKDNLDEYINTGVRMKALVSPELLLQIFYPNTPLHDGAVVISDGTLVAASCVMPLSASGVLTRSPERQMGLRHRAALGISEVSDAVAVVVSEETGSISVVHGGRMIRRLDVERLENILRTFFQPHDERRGLLGIIERLSLSRPETRRGER